MVDTIAFRIHDLEKHGYLVKHLFKEEINGIEDRRIDMNNPAGLLVPMRWKDMTYNHAAGRGYTRAYRFKFESSHSDSIVGRIDFERDFIHVEFSLCKYMHGDNVHQLVPHSSDCYKNDFMNAPWYDLDHCQWLVFQGAFKNFIAREFGEMVIDWEFVEVCQVDLCFNYIFKSVSQLETYLAFIREVKKKYARDETNHSAYGPSSIYYPSKIATFKIYHKGPEFDRHPGRAKRKANFKGLRELAYRTLRYELSFRPIAMRELWLRRSKYKPVVLAWRRWNKEGKFFYRNKWYGVGVSHGDRDKILEAGKKIDRRWTFFLGGQVSELDGVAVFDKRLFSEMLGYFHKISKQFMISGATDLNVQKDSVEYYNHEGELVKAGISKLSPSRIKMFAALLKSHSWNELRQKGIMSKAQFYRYKRFFQDVGYGDSNTIDNSLLDIDFSYRRYYENLSAVEIGKPSPWL